MSLWPWRWPPSLFFGSVDGLTVDGGPYDGVTPIELINADGDVVRTANVAEGVWSVQAPPDAGTVRLRVGDAVSEQEFAVQSAALVEVESATLVTPVEQVVRSVDLNAGFQALTHSGAELPVADFLQLFASPAAVDGIFLWDILDQGWTSWRAGLPDPLQAVSVIGQNTPMLLLLNAATTYSSEVLAHQSGEWSIINGLTSMAFLGPADTAIGDALTRIGGGTSYVDVIFRFNNPGQSWDSYRSALPAGLNLLQMLSRYDFLLVVGNFPSSWSYDAFTP